MKRGIVKDAKFKEVKILYNGSDEFMGLGTNDAGEEVLFELKKVRGNLYFIVGGFTRSFPQISDFFKGWPTLTHHLHDHTDTIKMFRLDEYYRNSVQKFVHVDEMHRG